MSRTVTPQSLKFLRLSDFGKIVDMGETSGQWVILTECIGYVQFGRRLLFSRFDCAMHFHANLLESSRYGNGSTINLIRVVASQYS